MIVYTYIDQFDRETGEKLKPRRVFDYYICDFTGEKIDRYDNPNSYRVNYNDNDPNFGDGPNEGWLYKMEEPYSYLSHELFNQSDYIFSLKNNYIEPLVEMLKQFNEDEGLDELFSFDFLFRWSRAKMLERVIKENKYKIEDFIDNEK